MQKSILTFARRKVFDGYKWDVLTERRAARSDGTHDSLRGVISSIRGAHASLPIDPRFFLKIDDTIYFAQPDNWVWRLTASRSQTKCSKCRHSQRNRWNMENTSSADDSVSNILFQLVILQRFYIHEKTKAKIAVRRSRRHGLSAYMRNHIMLVLLKFLNAIFALSVLSRI